MYPQQPYPYQPPPPPPKKKRTALWVTLGIIGGIAGLCLIGTIVALAGGSGGTDNNSNPPGSNGQVGRAVGLNQPARDGKFEFTVTKVECGKTTVGPEGLTRTAQGQFCLFSMTVKNIGAEARTFDATNQTAFGAGGVKYEADSLATAYLDDANSFLVDINPGNSVSGLVAFDIPKGASIERLELHDSPFSGGVTVTL